MKFNRKHYDTVQAAVRWQQLQGPLPPLATLRPAVVALHLRIPPRVNLRPAKYRRALMASMLANNARRAESYGRSNGFLPPGKKTTVTDLEHAEQLAALVPKGPLVIRVEGGLVQGVSWEGPEMDAVVKDYDIDGADEPELHHDDDGERYILREFRVDDRRKWQ